MKSIFQQAAAATCILCCQTKIAYSFSIDSSRLVNNVGEKTCCRRDVFGAVIVGSHTLLGLPIVAAALNESPTVVLRLETPQDKAGIALYDVTIGTPPRSVPAIQKVVSNKNPKLQPGLILQNFPNSQAVVDRIQKGPYPIELEFYNLDSSNGELGEAMTAQDALAISQRQSSPPAISNDNSYVKRVVKQADNCRLRSRRDDVLEIIYSAHIGSLDGITYDASEFRGTGRPYQMVLGSGDVLPGVDQGLYDMCVGEVRQLEIPPFLAYGSKGNKLYRIPPNARLVWEVELVSISTMREIPEETE